MPVSLSAEDGATLLRIARRVVCSQVSGGDAPDAPPASPALNQRCGCFVTISRQGKLRGCIGNFSSNRPLYLEVAEMAKAAATCDPRFLPMTPAELEDFSLEISVLSPLRRIEDINLIEVGKHGIYLEKGGRRGVLLPQVATEHHWDRKTFLQQTCHKAGLPADAWQAADIEIYIFSAAIFKE
ncbi:MAG: AmmeMemoRadiSam system protein A [Desulfuromonadales bacterium]|nr:AmmeMemoRadiSam system protein A [Desulfuromonadales bacterium]